VSLLVLCDGLNLLNNELSTRETGVGEVLLLEFSGRSLVVLVLKVLECLSKACILSSACSPRQKYIDEKTYGKP
jgi:hypothetical protein